MATSEQAVKLFGITNQLLEHDLDAIEREYGIDLHRGHQRRLDTDEIYYPQIENDIRAEAAEMAPHYEVFYSLEKTARRVVSEAFAEQVGNEWWDEDDRVPPKIKTETERRMKREVDSGMTPRSTEPLDFTTFGELGEIITTNWDVFGELFASANAVTRVMANLNTLRGPIAHCSALAEDEIVRLQLGVRDWFRLMQ